MDQSAEYGVLCGPKAIGLISQASAVKVYSAAIKLLIRLGHFCVKS